MEKNKHTKNNEEKIILWEGFRKELPWIIFWILLGVVAYGYWQDKKICDEALANPCDACYKLDQIMDDADYLFEDNNQIYVEESLINTRDKNPNDRTIENYIE